MQLSVLSIGSPFEKIIGRASFFISITSDHSSLSMLVKQMFGQGFLQNTTDLSNIFLHLPEARKRLLKLAKKLRIPNLNLESN